MMCTATQALTLAINVLPAPAHHHDRQQTQELWPCHCILNSREEGENTDHECSMCNRILL